jgi:alpha-N-arabinofuranosidase
MKSICVAAILGLGSVAQAATPAPVSFDWFEYQGHDAMRARPLADGYYTNPILPGYYPDPGVVAVGKKFYLVNSTFAHWPGIAIHESDDLVHWKLIGHALNDPAKVSFDGLGISRGVFAPSIHFHDGLFYIINTLVDAGGNFFVTAKNPAGPWSDPVWLKEIDGIDPSFFFDNDGKAYVLNNGPPEGKPEYGGHRAIWIQQFDVKAGKLIGPRKVIVNGGADFSKQPIWIEGPHLYRVNGWYYLMCAEGGTERNHSEVVFRSKSPWGPFEAFSGNPILTQRDLSPTRASPVTNAGHADLVQKRDGSWWAVFLASRPYQGFRFNTGRETFLLPVKWENGWPVILPHATAIPQPVPAGIKRRADSGAPTAATLTFTNRDEFDGAKPGPEWLQIHVPKQAWFDTTSKPGTLTIRPLALGLDAKLNTSFLARRQEDSKFDASTQLVPPSEKNIAAGLAAFQNEKYWYFFGTRTRNDGLEIFLERSAGVESARYARLLPQAPASLRLRISADGANYSFFYDAGEGWKPLRENDDGSILSTEVAGGFVGTVLGPFAKQE